MRWYEKPGVLDYIINSYAGVDVVDGKSKRQFLWDDEEGNTVIGNSRAFTDHLSAKFSLALTATSWGMVHEVLRALGEVAHNYQKRSKTLGKKFKNQQPESHIIKRKA